MASEGGAVVVMGKLAQPGRVKTRLTPAVSPDAAARLYRAFFEDVVWAVESAHQEIPLKRIFACAELEGEAAWTEASAMVPAGWIVQAQVAGDLGARMEGARLGAEARSVVIVGSDIPTLAPESILQAVRALAVKAREPPPAKPLAVLGPSVDGGFYLIAADRPLTPLFRDMSWSSPTVLAATLCNAEREGFDHLLLRAERDVDEWEDLRAVGRALRPESASARALCALGVAL